MREAETQKLYNSITNVKDSFVEEAQGIQDRKRKPRRPAWAKWCALAASLCLIAGAGTLVLMNLRQADDMDGGNGGNSGYNNCFWESRDYALLDVHREDFTPELSAEVQAAFADVPEVLKVYRTLTDSWFLAEDLTDFSQVLTTETVYVLPGYSKRTDGHWTLDDGAYSVYGLDENGVSWWGMSASAPGNDTVPYTFCRLTQDIIEEDLAGVDYEDYIIAHSASLYIVFIWARCANGEDVFITYPARPEFVGVENRGRYTLEEICHLLSESYHNP